MDAYEWTGRSNQENPDFLSSQLPLNSAPWKKSGKELDAAYVIGTRMSCLSPLARLDGRSSADQAGAPTCQAANFND